MATAETTEVEEPSTEPQEANEATSEAKTPAPETDPERLARQPACMAQRN